jgi:phage tail sheath protein FI
MDYKRPGVFVEEISTLPPSVAAVATAIPAFIGYTEKAVDDNDKNLDGIVIRRIETMLEYVQYFGGPLETKFSLDVDDSLLSYQFKRKHWSDATKDADTLHSHLMYYALRMYFDNGGGACYIVSVDRYFDGSNLNDINAEKIKDGIAALSKEDEPTLMVLADGIQLDLNDYCDRCKEILAQCNLLKDRFGIFDLPDNDQDATQFRTAVGNNYLSYGATYTPYLRTSMTYFRPDIDDVNVDVSALIRTKPFPDIGLKFSHLRLSNANPSIDVDIEYAKTQDEELRFNVTDAALVISGVPAQGDNPETDPGLTASELVTSWEAWEGDKAGFIITLIDGDKIVTEVSDKLTSATLDQLKDNYTQYYNDFRKALSKVRVVLPPGSAIAGIIASVDRDRGVWKAPANVSLSSVIEPLRKITNTEQERLNVDPTSGKSINAIRSFAGKGTLVWGSRTLAGNDNEWRYVPVRRLFIFMEESLQKATAFAVFEPNNTTTWLKVKAMAESFLYGLWQRGALAGPTPESAYFVNVGLGKTMTPQDILEGRLIMEVGVAAVRPAEFIILRFMHKLQEA